MRRYLSINQKGLCPKSCQLNSELSQLCLCFHLDHSALSCGLKSHQENVGAPLEVALTFSFFLWGFQLGQKEQGEFSGQLLRALGGWRCCRWGCAGCCHWGCPQTEPVLLYPAQPHLSHTGHLWLHYHQLLFVKDKAFQEHQSSKECFRKEMLEKLQCPIRSMKFQPWLATDPICVFTGSRPFHTVLTSGCQYRWAGIYNTTYVCCNKMFINVKQKLPREWQTFTLER